MPPPCHGGGRPSFRSSRWRRPLGPAPPHLRRADDGRQDDHPGHGIADPSAGERAAFLDRSVSRVARMRWLRLAVAALSPVVGGPDPRSYAARFRRWVFRALPLRVAAVPRPPGLLAWRLRLCFRASIRSITLSRGAGSFAGSMALPAALRRTSAFSAVSYWSLKRDGSKRASLLARICSASATISRVARGGPASRQ